MRLRIFLTLFIATVITLGALLAIRSDTFKNLNLFTENTTPKTSTITTTGNHKAYSQLQSILTTCFQKLEIPENAINKELSLEDSTLEIKISVPRGKPLEWVVWYLSSNITPTGYRLDDCYYESEKKGCLLKFTPLKKELPSLNIAIKRSNAYFSTTAKMAILIEEFAFETNETSVGILSFPEPLTFAVVGTKKLSTLTAQIATENHKEIVVLLPMEPLPRNFAQYNNALIQVHFRDDKIKMLINEAADAIPYFAGFCNFYGTRVLEDSHVMHTVLTEIKKRNGYFIITPDVRKSIAESIANSLDVPFKQIDYTINTNDKPETIQDSLRICAIMAQNTGNVLVKGKATASFITALKNTLPQLRQNGIRLVYVSEILKKSSDD
jgi:polysaccharide deacetylase 2 family uncharacterized protein YibQ